MAAQAQRMRERRHARRTVMSEINITPFVDIMLVLVVILMIAAPLLILGVPVDLPKATVAPVNQEREPLVLSLDKEGRIYIQEAEIQIDALVPRLIAVAESNNDLRIFVRGDRAINYGRVMEVMGLINRAGFTRVALIAEAPAAGSGAP